MGKNFHEADKVINGAISKDLFELTLRENVDESFTFDANYCCEKHLVMFVVKCMQSSEELAEILRTAVFVHTIEG